MTHRVHAPPYLPSQPPAPRLLLAIVLAATVPAVTGCFDGGAVVQAQQSETHLERMDEIAIGEFRITLPHAPGEPGGAVVEFQAFGKVSARDHDRVAKALLVHAPELRYRVLLTVRALTRSQLEEPNLRTLRRKLAELANAALDEQQIKSVGFHKFAFTTL